MPALYILSAKPLSHRDLNIGFPSASGSNESASGWRLPDDQRLIVAFDIV